jgi:hypothetical protein
MTAGTKAANQIEAEPHNRQRYPGQWWDRPHQQEGRIDEGLEATAQAHGKPERHAGHGRDNKAKEH